MFFARAIGMQFRQQVLELLNDDHQLRPVVDSLFQIHNHVCEQQKKLDGEVRRLVQYGHDEARRILTERLEDLHTLAKALLEYETLSGDEIIKVLQGIPPVREDPDSKLPPTPAVSVPITHPAPGVEPGAAPA